MTDAKYKIGIIGPKDVIAGFRALGADIFPSNSPEEAIKTVQQLKNIDENDPKYYAVIMITSNIMEQISPEEYAKISKGALPAIISIPTTIETGETGLKKLKKLTERAIGSDILS